jgi:hypothetical protein
MALISISPTILQSFRRPAYRQAAVETGSLPQPRILCFFEGVKPRLARRLGMHYWF